MPLLKPTHPPIRKTYDTENHLRNPFMNNNNTESQREGWGKVRGGKGKLVR